MHKMKFWAGLALCLALAWGCSTNQTTVTYKAEVATDGGVRAAMIGWGGYVAAQHPGTNSELKVLAAFRTVKASELALVDATASLAADATNTNAVTAAQNALTAAQVDLVNLIGSLTNNPH